MTSKRLYLLLPVIAVYLRVCTQMNFEVDLWHHVLTGREMFLSGGLLTQDVFTHTIAGQPITNQNWVAQLLLCMLFAAGGHSLVTFVMALVYAASFAVLSWLVWRQCGHARVTAAVVLLAAALSAENLSLRPQAFSMLFFVLQLAVLINYPEWRWTPWIVMGLEILWANVHGAFILGVALPGLLLVGQAASVVAAGRFGYLLRDRVLRTWLLATVLSAAAMFCTPHPQMMLEYVFNTANLASSRGISEWQNMSINSWTGASYLLSLFLLMVVLCYSRTRPAIWEWLLLGSFMILGAMAVRMVVWWAPVQALILGRHAATLVKPERAGGESAFQLHMNRILIVVILAIGVCYLPWFRTLNPLLPDVKRRGRSSSEPFGASAYLREVQAAGPAFNLMEWGSYLSWHHHPRLLVFIDGRIDFFPSEVWSDYVHVRNARSDWDRILQRHDVRWVIADLTQMAGLVEVLEQSPRWQESYRDELAVVFRAAP